MLHCVQSCAHTHTAPWNIRTHWLYRFHSTSIICRCDNVTCDPCVSPWTGGSWPVKPFRCFPHVFAHGRLQAPYAPPSHSSLSNTIYSISNSDSVTSHNPRAFVSSPLLGIFLAVCFSCSSGSCLSHLPLSHARLRETRRRMTTEGFLVFFSIKKQNWLTTRPYEFCSW